MNAIEKALCQKFGNDIERISEDFINVFKLNFKQEVANLSDPVMRWIDFRLRCISPTPRKVVFSNTFPKPLDNNIELAFRKITRLIEEGKDINPYQGKGLIEHHDTSGKKKSNRTDLLWADWGIFHLHLTEKDLPADEYFSERSDWLLFGIVTENEFGAIDIIRHDDPDIFSETELFEIIGNSWPALLERFEVKGILPPQEEHKLKSEDHGKLRKAGISSFIKFKDKLYIGPGMGVTSASTSLRVTMNRDHAFKCAVDFACLVASPDQEFQKEMNSKMISHPDFNLCITPKGMALYESNLDKAWLLPRRKGEPQHYLEQLTDILSPDWAVNKLFHDRI